MKNESIKSGKRFSIANLKIMDGMLEPNGAEFLHPTVHHRMPIRVVRT